MIAAVSAERISSIDDFDTGAPHIGTLIGVPSATGPDERRTVHVRGDARELSFVVDQPVSIIEIGRQDVRPISGLGESALPDFLLGFADDGGELVALLDLRGVLSRLGESDEEE